MTSEAMLVDVGKEFKVPLKSSPTTGFVWIVDQLPEGLEYLGSDSERLLNHAQAGDPMIQVFHFRALKAGEFSIQFNLKRVWESESANTLIVTVKAN